MTGKYFMDEENIVLCGANSYVQKYYFNDKFSAIPRDIQDELKIMCVLFTEEVGGILTLEYEPDGTLEFRVQTDDSDYLFDDIGSELAIREYGKEKSDLLSALELFYRVVFLGEKLEDSDDEGEG